MDLRYVKALITATLKQEERAVREFAQAVKALQIICICIYVASACWIYHPDSLNIPIILNSLLHKIYELLLGTVGEQRAMRVAFPIEA